jgi:DNA-binding transcriptional LysR family regulator
MGQMEQIRVFASVAEHDSFAQAAKHLNISASAATRHVSELERKLGVQLLVRTTRRVSLTLAGETYLTQVAPLLRGLEQADDSVRSEQGQIVGSLRISAPPALRTRLLPDLVARFRALHPRVVLNLQLSSRFVDVVSEDYDMALRISEPPTDLSSVWRRICAVPRVLVAAPDYLIRHPDLTHPDALKSHDFLHYAQDNRSAPLILSNGQTHARLRLEPRIITNNDDVLSDLAIRGEGITLLPRFIVADSLENGQLVELLPTWHPPEISLSIAYPPYTSLPAKVAQFTTFLESYIADHPDVLA